VASPQDPLLPSEKCAGWLAIFVFVLTFVPQPIQIDGIPEEPPTPGPSAPSEKSLSPEEFDL